MTELELSRRERKKGETRERIFKAACKLFRHKGFEATTIDEIADKADVAKGTFFNYFPRKEAVLGWSKTQGETISYGYRRSTRPNTHFSKPSPRSAIRNPRHYK